jgi:glucose/arabinose dehydrogenase
MRLERIALACVLLAAVAVTALAQTSDAGRQSGVLTGKAAFGDWRADAPLVRRKISVDDLPKPFATPSINKPVRVIARPSGALPRVPPGFQVELFAAGFNDPRALVVAPNGDLFVAESEPGRIRVLRIREGEGKPRDNTVFASGLDAPFGIAFYPPGSDPQWVYIANVDSVVRYPYRNGDVKQRHDHR